MQGSAYLTVSSSRLPQGVAGPRLDQMMRMQRKGGLKRKNVHTENPDFSGLAPEHWEADQIIRRWAPGAGGRVDGTLSPWGLAMATLDVQLSQRPGK